MTCHDDWLLRCEPGHAEYPERYGDGPSEADELREENHTACPVCKADICQADDEGNVGRENCPCDGDGAVPVMSCDGEALCSEACRATWEAEGREAP